MTRATTTRKRVELAVAALEQLIRQAPISSRTGRHQYEGRVTLREVLRLSGVKSAATLHHKHHDATRKWLAKRIIELKVLAGRGATRKVDVDAALRARDREKKLAEELAAANYKILELERKLAQAEQRGRRNSTVVPFKGKR